MNRQADNPRQTAPFGSWPSAFSADGIARGSKRLAQPLCRPEGIYWLEGRPQEGGRTALCRWQRGRVETLTPRGYSVRTRAQEYGGGAWCAVDAERRLFMEDSDQGLYLQQGRRIEPLCVLTDSRFGDLQWDSHHERLLAVREVDAPQASEPRAELVAIDLSGRLQTLVRGADFYTAPRASADGRQLAWLEWDHPDMPWDRTRLMVASLDEQGRIQSQGQIAGQEPEALFQPEWHSDGRLYFVSDRWQGWWNLHAWDGQSVEAITHERAELGLPYWQFNMRSWGFVDEQTLLAARSSQGFWSLQRVRGAETETLDSAWSSIQHLHCAHGQGVMLAGRPDHPLAVVRIDPDQGPVEVLARSAPPPDQQDGISQAEAIAFATGQDETAHALYYPPTHPDYQGPPDERPPLLVKCHGGPTGATDTAYEPRIQYWTSRGFAVVDVNYRGSTGYGRPYRHRLYGGWGQLDVEDCQAVVAHLCEQGRADPSRCLISGSSAGGYTVLAALTFSDAFAAGASHYGIGDLAALDAATHKFESRYTQKLVGPWPEAREQWQARSPIHHVHQLKVPVIFFQGDEDKVVPPEQARTMADALRQQGLPVAHVVFEGEGHGFRRAQNIRAALEMELDFYGRVLGFEPHGPAPALTVDNL